VSVGPDRKQTIFINWFIKTSFCIEHLFLFLLTS
jgi:hypothetical protein